MNFANFTTEELIRWADQQDAFNKEVIRRLCIYYDEVQQHEPSPTKPENNDE